jgi:hypothetical protein
LEHFSKVRATTMPVSVNWALQRLRKGRSADQAVCFDERISAHQHLAAFAWNNLLVETGWQPSLVRAETIHIAAKANRVSTFSLHIIASLRKVLQTA